MSEQSFQEFYMAHGIGVYKKAFTLLHEYDSGSLSKDGLSTEIMCEMKYEYAMAAISVLRFNLDGITDFFGIEKDDSFKGVLRSVAQTFDGKYLYPTIEEQAAHLLYLIIKGHPFSDGNKRIGACLFMCFIDNNNHHFNMRGKAKIDNAGLTALSILVALSDPADKERIILLICNMIKND